METYIALLRGINVGTKNRIKMNVLISLFEQLHFTSIQSYIQSGNILFQTDKKTPVLEIQHSIEKMLKEKFENNIPVLLRTKKEWKDIYLLNPYLNHLDFQFKTHVIFLDKVNYSENKTLKESYPNEVFNIANKEIYLWCEEGYINTKLNNSNVEKRLKTTATT